MLKNSSETSPLFLLLNIPVMRSRLRYYPAAYVAGVIKSCNWHVDYIDLNEKVYESAPERVQELWDNAHTVKTTLNEIIAIAADVFYDALSGIELNKYLVIGVSLYSSCRDFTTPLIKTLRSLNYEGIILFGGVDCFLVNNGKEYLNSSYAPTAVSHGEAEEFLPKFLNAILNDKNSFPNVPGLLYKNESGTIINTGFPPKVKLNECDIIADYSIYNGNYIETLNTFTSRGCINKCTFCSEWGNFRPLRYRSPETVIKEIKSIKKYLSDDCKDLWLLESNFNTSKKYVRAFAQALINNSIDIKWQTMGCFRVELEDELLALLAKSGLITMMIGMESASQVVIDYMRKEFDINNAQKQLLRFKNAGINITLPIMNGFPGESASDFMISNAFILRYINAQSVSFCYTNFCIILANSPLYDYPNEFGIVSAKKSNEHRISDNYWNWASFDGLNVFNVRLLRMAINGYLITDINSDDSDPSKFFHRVNINDPHVAVELAKIIYLLGIAVKDSMGAKDFIFHISKNAPRLHSVSCIKSRLDFLSGTIPGLSLNDWIYADKKDDILRLILDHLFNNYRKLKCILDTQIYTDLNVFKAQLYLRPENMQISGNVSFQIIKTSLSEHDHGQFIILEGFAWDSKNNVPACAIYAETASHVIDFLYGIENPGYSNEDSLYYTGFWGKVKRSYFKEEKMFKIFILFSDGSHACEVIDIQ